MTAVVTFFLGPFVALGFAALLSSRFAEWLRGLMWEVWGNSVMMSCPGHYLGKERDPDKCGDCPWYGKCNMGVMSN